jgi:hypothetical protein
VTASTTMGKRPSPRSDRIPHRRFSDGPVPASKFDGIEPAAALENPQLAKYRRERNAFMAELAEALGRCVIMIEV